MPAHTTRPPLRSALNWIGTSADNCRTADPMLSFCSGPSLVSEKIAGDCLANTEVKIYELIGGVHTWYTGPMNNPAGVPYNAAFNATTGVTTDDILWNFFVHSSVRCRTPTYEVWRIQKGVRSIRTSRPTTGSPRNAGFLRS